MTEEKARPRENSKDTSNSSAAAVGRRMGILVYWVVLVFVLSAGAYSIIPQAFGFQKRARPQAPNAKKCTKETRALSIDLLDKTKGFCDRLESRKMQKWLNRWDRRYRNLTANCAATDANRINLKKLRDGLESIKRNCEKELP